MTTYHRTGVILFVLLLALCPLAPAAAQAEPPAGNPTGNLLFLPLLNQAGAAESSALVAPSASSKPLAKNIIVMISDGWGYNHLDAVSYYEYGKDARQIYNRFPFQWAMSTYSYYCSYDPALAWSDWEYVKSCYTDSASAATALAAGIKTYDAAIGVDVNGYPVPNALELAEQKGKATGVVTSVEWTHATPAGHVAHNVSRNDYEGIGLEMVNVSAADVIMGAGHPWYDANGILKATPNTYKYVGGQATWDALVAGTAGGDADGDGVADPWTLVQTRAEFQSLMNGPTPKRVLGTAQVFETLQQGRSGDAFADPYVVPKIETVPTLTEMTVAALNILDEDPDGLYLMVEGGAIDWASHSNQSGRMIEEAIEFERAVEAVVDWVQKNSNWGETLLIITGDHETGYLWGPGSNPAWNPIVNNGAGNLPGMQWNSPNHTNSLMILSAKCDAARLFRPYATKFDPVRGAYIDNTDVAKVVFYTLDPK
jgi:alkaline phosphatase